MGKEVVHTVQVEFGDCDPARFVNTASYGDTLDIHTRIAD